MGYAVCGRNSEKKKQRVDVVSGRAGRWESQCQQWVGEEVVVKVYGKEKQ